MHNNESEENKIIELNFYSKCKIYLDNYFNEIDRYSLIEIKYYSSGWSKYFVVSITIWMLMYPSLFYKINLQKTSGKELQFIILVSKSVHCLFLI